jgi:Zn-dependent protease
MNRERTQWLPPTPEPFLEPTAPEPALPEPEPEQSRLRRALGPLAVAGAMAVKFFAKVKALLLLAPKLKLLTTSGSMLLSVGAYTLLWGWRFAVGFVALLFVHEMGHYIQLRREGVRPSGMVFIPFLGAAVAARSLGGSALAEARVGLAGPLLGSLACALLLPLTAGDDFWRALVFTGFFINLINLVPIVPFDGGRAMAAMAPWMWFVGFGLMVVAVVAFPNPVLILFLLLGGMETWRRWKARRGGEEGNEAYYHVSPRHRFLVGAVYVGLIVLLALGMDATFLDRASRI